MAGERCVVQAGKEKRKCITIRIRAGAAPLKRAIQVMQATSVIFLLPNEASLSVGYGAVPAIDVPGRGIELARAFRTNSARANPGFERIGPGVAGSAIGHPDAISG